MDSSTIRPAQKNDTSDLAFFLNQARYVHRHLDWRPILDWLGEGSFWILDEANKIQAAFACPDDPPGIAWMRLFACSSQITPDEAWVRMFTTELDGSAPFPNRTLAAIALQDWFMRLLKRHGWTEYQQIVTLAWEGGFPAEPRLPDGGLIRPILPEDLPEVTRIDNLAFEPLWRLSQSALTHAYEQSAFATLFEIEGQIIAYQMSTATSFNAHLARLAVLPQSQGQKIGYTLVYDLLKQLDRLQVRSATVNTQHDNLASQALYQRLGFIQTGEHFPVLVYQD